MSSQIIRQTFLAWSLVFLAGTYMQAQDLRIVSFGIDGEISWADSETGGIYQVQHATDLTNDWLACAAPLDFVESGTNFSARAVVSLEATNRLFYRVAKPWIVAVEEWASADDGLTTGTYVFVQTQMRDVLVHGEWHHVDPPDDVVGPFTNGVVSISNAVVHFSASGTAYNSNPSIPSGYETSPFTLTVDGIMSNGYGTGVSTTRFTRTGWPSSRSATWSGVLLRGTHITK